MTFGLLRVKNEGRWIGRVVASLFGVCDKILVLDDHSADDTVAICEAAGCVVYRSHFEGIHEARDKDWLLEKVWCHGAQLGDCVLCIDGDEILHPDDCGMVRTWVNGASIAASLRVLYLWDRETRFRVDGVYGNFHRPSLFRLTERRLSFRVTGFGGSFHCSSVPASHIAAARSFGARLLHLGYLHGADRIRKYHWYNSVDGGNKVEDGYRHMGLGDLFPESARFKGGGPIAFAELPAVEVPGGVALPRAA